jgi:hypothetical protein
MFFTIKGFYPFQNNYPPLWKVNLKYVLIE